MNKQISNLFKHQIECNRTGIAYVFKQELKRLHANTSVFYDLDSINLSVEVFTLDYQYTEEDNGKYYHLVNVFYEYRITCSESGRHYESEHSKASFVIVSDKLFDSIFDIYLQE